MSSADTDFPFKKVAVIGPGLIGGSILLKLASLPEDQRPELSVWARRVAALDEIEKFIPNLLYSTEIDDAITNADLIILTTPVEHMVQLGNEIKNSPYLESNAIITDVGSVKGKIAPKLTEIFANEDRTRTNFISSHPMSGSEKTGFKAAQSDLFHRKPCSIGSTSNNIVASAKLKEFWRSLGCVVYEHDFLEHDEIVAAISHVPHILAVTLINNTLAHYPDLTDMVGPSFRDLTRVAASDPELWNGIIMENKAPITAVIQDYIKGLEWFLKTIEEENSTDFKNHWQKAQKLRQKLDDA